MAMTTTYPGVYIQEVPSGVRPIESAGTSTAVFIGVTGKKEETAKKDAEGNPVLDGGGNPVWVSVTAPKAKPKLIFKWADYVNEFGGIQSPADAMGLAVYNFFLNGGGAAYIAHLKEDEDADYKSVLDSLEKTRDISIVCLPGKTWPANESTLGLAISHAEKMKNRMVIVDMDSDTTLNEPGDVDELSLSTSEFGATYYPWLEIANPFYKPADPDTGEGASGAPTLQVAPSGFMAGMWAKIDGRRGVWKAPAGVETALLGVAGVADHVDDAQQGNLNPKGINCIRKLPGFGPVVWGARTLATKANPEWRYVPIRRTANMIRESIYNNIQWAVFEPNDHRLWSSLRVNIDAFMNGLWRSGAFQGETASDAYFVSCGLGDTMTQDDIDTGKVIVEVGFAPLKPAEFVIVRIQQKVAQQ